MSPGAPDPGSAGLRARLRPYAPLLLVTLGWVVAFLRGAWGAPPLQVAEQAVENVIVRVLSGLPGSQQLALHVFHALTFGLTYTFAITLFLATVGLPLGFLVRMVARARLRAGGTDAMARARGWTAAHPRAAAALLSILPAAFQSLFVRMAWWRADAEGLLVLLGTAAVMGVLQWRAARAGLRSLLAPLTAGAAAAPAALDAGEIRFDAVAVTRETRAAVGALAALTVGTVGWIAQLPIGALFRDPRVFTAIGGYVALAAASALAFQRASRVAIGKDGIYVSGTSRRRFFPYRDLDEVRERRGDLELVRRGKVLLRLQLHGEDAARRAPILERIQLALASAQASARDGAAHFVASAPSGTVAASARGGTDYRVPSVSRDALWALVEGPGVDAAARTAAAHALAEAGDPGERRRLRVAAGHCADPQVRVALEELAGPDDDERTVWRALRSLRKAP